jgi:ubiquinone/menaquinone biosynthesis C-methylase UbiE
VSQADTTFEASAVAFDRIAPRYDSIFTESTIGQAQRKAVWQCAIKAFPTKLRLLELNCGTGADAFHFASQGFEVTACDVSPEMIQQARRKAISEDPKGNTQFLVRATEEISGLPLERPFEGVFSNFSGLNCVEDLAQVAQSLSHMLQPKATALFCFSTRYCLWEMAWYIVQGDIRRAFRRCRGICRTQVGGAVLNVYYPKLRHIRRAFSPHFRVKAVYGIGVTVPPSYVQEWISRRPALLRKLEQIDAIVRACPGLRVLGDHMLVQLERRTV